MPCYCLAKDPADGWCMTNTGGTNESLGSDGMKRANNCIKSRIDLPGLLQLWQFDIFTGSRQVASDLLLVLKHDRRRMQAPCLYRCESFLAHAH